jgi:hypothetical protein
LGAQETNTHTVKIVDFGSAVLSSSGGSGPTSFMGGGGSMSCTPAFRSPESLQPGYRLSFQVGRRGFLRGPGLPLAREPAAGLPAVVG